VKNPLCLEQIREKTRDFQYKASADFLADMKLIADNSRLYNGANHVLTGVADSLVKKAERMVENMVINEEEKNEVSTVSFSGAIEISESIAIKENLSESVTVNMISVAENSVSVSNFTATEASIGGLSQISGEGLNSTDNAAGDTGMESEIDIM
jgi:hypothetical protein